MTYTKKYWSEGEYTTRTGEKYTGYVGIKDGKAYIFDIEEELIPGDAYITNINTSDFFIDRVLAADLKLPYSKGDIQFGANDFLYSSTVIDIAEKLQANNDYIFRNNILSDTTLPAVNECTIFSSKDKPLYLYQYRDDNFNLIKLPKTQTYGSGSVTIDDKSYTIAMMRNYKYNGTSDKKYAKNVTADIAYNDCYQSNGEPNTTYSHIPYIAIDRELFYEKGGVLSRYNFNERGFSGVTKNDPFFYSKIETRSEYYINKNKDIIKIDEDGKVDLEKLKYYKNPNFIYSDLKPAIDKNSSIEENVNSYIDNENYTLIPAISKCDKYRYKYYIKDDKSKTIYYGNINDTYLNIKNKPGFKSLVFEWNEKTTTNNTDPEPDWEEDYIPMDYMTADNSSKDVQKLKLNAEIKLNFPSFDNCKDFYEITDTDGVLHYFAGGSHIPESINIKYVNNPKYYSKTYVPASDMTWDDLYNELSKNKLSDYEYNPYIDKFEHSVTVSDATFDFDKVKNADVCITEISYDETKKRYATALGFLITEKQLAIIKFKQYIDNTFYNTEDYEAAFKLYDEEGNVITDKVDGEANVVIIDRVDPADNASLKFKELSSIKIYKDNLYLVDESLNMVLHYDIGYLLNSGVSGDGVEPFKKYSISLLNVLQGDGTKNDKVYFNKPHYINADDEYVYVVDRGNKSVKVFSHTLNYVKSLQNGYFAQHDIQAVASSPYSFKLENGTELSKNSVWIFSTQSNRFYLSILEGDNVVYYGQLESLKIDDDAYSWKEEIRSINFSSGNSNYYYFSTTKRVYKFHATHPLCPFASLSYYKQHSLNSALIWSQISYPWNKIPSLYAGISDDSAETKLTWGYERPITSAEVLNNKCFALCGYDYYDKIEHNGTLIDKQFKGDLIFHFGVYYDNAAIAKFIEDNNKKYRGDLTFDNMPSGDKIEKTKSVALFTYIEPDSYINAISDTMFKSYPKYNVTDNIGDEYINPLTFNKLIYQIVYNLIQIKEQIFGKFKGAANADGVVVYDAIIMDNYIDELKLIESSNYFVHNNEVVSITINRIFEDILTLQENIVKMMQTTFMSSQSFVNSTTKLI